MITPKVLGKATLTGSLVDIYTCPSATVTRAEHITISNGSTDGTVTIKQYFASTTNAKNILNALEIAANETLELVNIILEAGDKIQATATTTTDCDIIIWGAENA
jgi:hypothetical protein